MGSIKQFCLGLKQAFFSKALDNKGQMSIEGLIMGIISAIMYLVIAAYVFQPILNIMSPTIENVGGGFGTVAESLIVIGVYIVMPLLILASMVALARPKVEMVQ